MADDDIRLLLRLISWRVLTATAESVHGGLIHLEEYSAVSVNGA